MKKVKVVMLMLMLSCIGCGQPNEITYQIIGRKFYTQNDCNYKHQATPLPIGICQFEIRGGSAFQDSCFKYNVNDTVGHPHKQ